MDEKERLRAELHGRVKRFMDSGNAGEILEPSAERAAAALFDQSRRIPSSSGVTGMDVDDAYILGYFYWCRSKVAPAARAAGELERAKIFFRPLHAVAPQHVPDDVRDQPLDSRNLITAVEVAELMKRAGETYDNARRTRDVGDLDAAIALMRLLITTDLPEEVTTHLHGALGQALRDRHDWTGQLNDLDEAIAAARSAVDTAGPGTDAEAEYLGLLESLVTRRFDRTGAPEHLDDVVTVRSSRLAAVGDGGGAGRSATEAARLRLGVAAMLVKRYEQRAHAEDLQKAVRHLREPASDTDDPRILSDRYVLLHQCFRHGGPGVDESDVIAAGMAALERLPDGGDAPALRINVAQLHLDRYEATGHSGDLASALDLAQTAVEGLSDDDERLVAAWGVLGTALLRQHERVVRTNAVYGYGSAIDNDLQAALRLLRRAVERTPAGHPRRSTVLDQLATAYLRGADLDHRPELLHQAVDTLRQVVAAGADDEDHSAGLRRLGHALQQRYLAFGDEADLDEAVQRSEQALAAARSGTYLALRARLGLAEALATRLIRHPDRDDDRRTAMEIYREVAVTEAVGISARVSAARSWGRILQEAGRYDEALDGYDAMVALLSDVAPVGLNDADRIRRVEEWEGWPALAVSCAIASGRLQKAVELLERARLVTAPATSVAAADVDLLRDRHPALAAEVDAAQRDLAAGRSTGDVVFLPAGIVLVPAELGDERGRTEQAGRTWHHTVARIRDLPDFDRFLMPAGWDELQHAADRGPVAVPVASADRCDVLLVTAGGLDVVPLGVSPDEVAAHANRFGDIIGSLARGAMDLDARAAAEGRLADLFAWLWRGTVQPTLHALGFLDPADADRAPHLWWSPSGVFAVFPLHAAGATPEDGALDRVRSSYAPSLRLLAHLNTREPVTGRGGSRLLAVGLSDTPGLAGAQLPDVARETEAVRRCLPAGRGTVLSDGAATVAAVRAALSTHDMVHFACHAQQYPREPSRSELYLYDGGLRVGDLRGSDLRHTRLAVLSACETAMSGTTLLDEGLHLGAAMHVAGCPDVVGTLWRVGDGSATEIVEHLYPRVVRDGVFLPGAVASALHSAVRELRAAAPDLCSSWAPFVHLGASR